mmetsp:Transcript_64948/g.152811  ORF Transcript_64948/g.152811 Transcript_64948/m.152811 type:complete len:226 (-) Transcript_64948:527-1204(-)
MCQWAGTRGWADEERVPALVGDGQDALLALLASLDALRSLAGLAARRLALQARIAFEGLCSQRLCSWTISLPPLGRLHTMTWPFLWLHPGCRARCLPRPPTGHGSPASFFPTSELDLPTLRMPCCSNRNSNHPSSSDRSLSKSNLLLHPTPRGRHASYRASHVPVEWILPMPSLWSHTTTLLASSTAGPGRRNPDHRSWRSWATWTMRRRPWRRPWPVLASTPMA